MIYLQLFLSFLQIGAFSFGGGYAAMPLIQSQVVDSHKWLSMAEFTNLITISQMTPGPIAVNSATFVGLKVAGIGGAAVATAGCILALSSLQKNGSVTGNTRNASSGSCCTYSLSRCFYSSYSLLAGRYDFDSEDTG